MTSRPGPPCFRLSSSVYSIVRDVSALLALNHYNKDTGVWGRVLTTAFTDLRIRCTSMQLERLIATGLLA